MFFLINVIKIIFAISFLVFIHEFGHFCVAKKCNMKVNAFAIGFGPKLWKKQRGETEFSIRAIPLGGFVDLEGESENSDDPRAFINKPVLQRILVVVAGALVNIVFAIIVLIILTMSTGKYGSNVVVEVSENNASLESGLREGDVITSINCNKVSLGSEIQNYLSENQNEYVSVGVLRNNVETVKYIKPVIAFYIDIDDSGVILDSEYNNKNIDFIKQLGFKINDKILAINGNKVSNLSDIENQIRKIDSMSADFTLLRDDKEIESNILVKYMRTYYLGIGLELKNDISGLFKYAVYSTGNVITLMYTTLYDLVTGQLSVNALSGPVGIATEISKTNGMVEFLSLVSLLSLNLGIMNLLPILPLDGGKILVLLVEAVRRKKISPEKENAIGLVGYGAFLVLAIFVTYFDILKL